LTHRQYAAWQAWLDEEWNRPSRSDHYQMQTAMVVAQANAKSPKKVKFKHYKLDFGPAGRKKRPKMTREQAAAHSKAKWLGIMTAPVTEVEE
jgi:hypothetical protein